MKESIIFAEEIGLMDVRSVKIQLVTFQLSEEYYGIDIMDVKEIQRIQTTRPIPNAPSYVEGIFKLRNDIIPVINLQKRFHLKRAELSEEDRLLSGIVILELDGKRLGVIIDKVSKVLSIEPDDVQTPPQLISGIGAQYISGVVHQEQGYLIILDIHKLFSAKELQQLNTIKA
jgi:purine-binding chemotaxis protein CheW